MEIRRAHERHSTVTRSAEFSTTRNFFEPHPGQIGHALRPLVITLTNSAGCFQSLRR